MIRFAKAEDIPAIMKFIDEHWRKGHIMSRDRTLFEFQHCWDDEVSFVISETDGILTGILGYIPYAKAKNNKNKNVKNEKNKRDVTTAIWKTLKTSETMQGINMFSFLREHGDIRAVASPGINPKTIAVYKFFDFETGKMRQWYRLRKVAEYKIAKIYDNTIPAYDANDKITVTQINNFEQAVDFGIEDCLIRERRLLKSIDFIKRRYFEHPTFIYLKYGLRFGEKKLLVIMRIQECNNSKALRVIDCLGDLELFEYFTQTLDALLKENNCEYADCFETGINSQIFLSGGWLEVAPSGNIIPDYFAPFEQRNVEIYYMSELKGIIMFKGDGDMDRPN